MKVAALIGFVAATLVVASALHLARVVEGGSPPFDPDRGGIAEAVIAVVLAAGAVAFAIVGFGIGLSMTVRGGGAGDIAYHLTMLPLLLFALAALSGASRRGRASRRTA